ncbi:unnamed protein product [Phytophthora lilii]|uniref:Unnamed protein product n=1 Tax=Phytophthora lilii TaxID=2077276 RepID=A0A9W6WPA4_9STRA|nr:unnamed protein product [Phytophthora lilii]
MCRSPPQFCASQWRAQDPRVFDEAESFTLAPASISSTPLNESSVACAQGGNIDAGWTCSPYSQSHRVCGHRGVFSFVSPLYAIAEAAGNITITVRRSGGGLGSATLLYDLEHVTSTSGDVSPTMFYTSSQKLDFAPGVVSLAFKLQIHDDHELENNKTFRLRLREPFAPTDLPDVAPASLGNQWRTLVTILDDDALRPVANLSRVVSPETSLMLGGAAGDLMTFQVQSVLGNGVPGVDPFSKAVFLMTSYIEEDDYSTELAVFRTLRLGSVTQSGGVDVSLFTCSWFRERAGNYSVAVQLLYPGGLRGEYYGDAWLGETFDSASTALPILSRIDRHVNFTWNTGPAFSGGQSHFSVRWSGWLKPISTGTTMLAVSVVGYARLWVDDMLVIDRWGAGGETSYELPVIRATSGVDLDISRLYSLVLEYRAPRQGDVYVRLLWGSVGAAKMEIIPAQQLFSGSHVQDSPFTNVLVTPALTASTALSTSTLRNDRSSVSPALQVIAGDAFSFSVLPRDIYGNRRRSRDQYDIQRDIVAASLTLTTDRSLGGTGTKTEDALVSWSPGLDVFRVVAKPQRSGDYSMSVKINSNDLAANPFTVTVLPAQLNAARCVLSGSGLLAGRVAGQAASVALITRDLYANRVYSGGLTGLRLQASLSSSSVPTVVTAEVFYNVDGTYKFTYTPRVVAQTNVQTTFEVTTRDSSGNNVLTGGVASALTVVLEHLDNGNVSGNTCTDLLNGHYTCTYIPHYVGPTRLHVKLSQQAISGSPFLVDVTAGPALGSRCMASGDALVSAVAGQRTNFTISIYDTFGNLKTNAGSESITVVFTGPGALTSTVNAAVAVTYIGGGIFVVAYTLSLRGAYKMNVAVDGVSIDSSPFTMYTYPALASPTTTSLDLLSPALSKTLVDSAVVFIAGASIIARLTTRDKIGNTLESGGNLFHLDEAVRSFLDVPIEDEKNGSYLVSLRPTRSTLFPFTPKLMVPGGLNGTYYAASNVPVGTATADSSLDHSLVMVKRVDPLINFNFGEQPPSNTHSAETFSVRWDGFLLPRYSEIYTFEVGVLGFASLKVGTASAAIQLGATSAVLQVSLTAQSFVDLEFNFTKLPALPNATAYLWWSSLSQEREVVPASQLFTSWKILNNVPTLDVKPATANATKFTPEFADSVRITNSAAVRAVIDKPFIFTVVTRDRFSNKLGGEDYCTLYVLLPQVPNGNDQPDLTIADLHDGSYKVNLVPHLVGNFSLYVAALPDSKKSSAPPGGDALVAFLAPYNIAGSPFKLQVDPGLPSAATSTLIDGGFVSTVAGVLTSFLLELRDGSANRLTSDLVASCLGQVQIKLKGVSSGVEIHAQLYQMGEGDQYSLFAQDVRVEYTSKLAGLFAVLLSVDGGTTFTSKTTTLRIFPNVATASTSFVSPNGAGAAAIGAGLGPQILTKDKYTFYVTVRDTFGNIRDSGGDLLVARVHGPDSSASNVTDLGNGEYVITYRAMLPGAYEIETRVANPERGLTGYYYVDTGSLQRNLPTAVRTIDAVIDFDWSKNITMRGYPRVVWRGFLRPLFTEEYMLSANVQTDVGSAVGVYIDGQTVIDGLNTGVTSGRVALVGGRLHAITVEYRSASVQEDPGYLSLFWQSDRQSRQLIPTQSLIAEASEILPRTQLRLLRRVEVQAPHEQRRVRVALDLRVSARVEAGLERAHQPLVVRRRVRAVDAADLHGVVLLREPPAGLRPSAVAASTWAASALLAHFGGYLCGISSNKKQSIMQISWIKFLFVGYSGYLMDTLAICCICALGLSTWMRMAASSPLGASALRVALLTDVEGNWQYVRNVVRQSSCLRLSSSGQEETLELQDDCMLVFGGDAGDKGDHTLKFLADQEKSEDGEDALEAVNTKANRLKWMLEHTMGAQGDFERRRAELSLRQAVGDRNEVTDDAVVKSYVDSVKEGGVLREYLLHGSLAFVKHQTLFVHGGIINGDGAASLSALGRVPDQPSKRFNSVSEWVDKLNAWYHDQVQEWIEQPTWSKDHASRGGNELLNYVLPGYTGSVVMGRHLLPSGMPTPVPDEIASLLSESGIRRVIIGHTPHGNCPTVVKQPQQHDICAADRGDVVTFEDVIMCDTSYSDMRAPDNRGNAASEVVLEPSGRVFVNGVLEDDRRISYDVQNDPWVGQLLQDGTMVKARLANEEATGEEISYLVFRVENGYSYFYQYRTVTELAEIGVLN